MTTLRHRYGLSTVNCLPFKGTAECTDSAMTLKLVAAIASDIVIDIIILPLHQQCFFNPSSSHVCWCGTHMTVYNHGWRASWFNSQVVWRRKNVLQQHCVAT